MSGSDRECNPAGWQAVLEGAGLAAVVLEQSAEALYVVDRRHRILFWSAAAAALAGYRQDEVTGRSCDNDLLDHVSADGQHLCASGCPLKEVIAGGHPREAHLLLRHKHGHRIPVRVRLVPVRDGSGQVVAAVEFFSREPELNRRALPLLDAYGCRDTETGAATRPYGELRLRQSFDELAAFGVPFGWLRIGLDGVEQLGEKFGYAVVSHAVALAARTLDRVLGASDLLVRWNSCEFRVVAGNADAGCLMRLGRSLAMAVAASNLRWWGDSIEITISVGGAGAETGDSLDSLEDRAGEAFEISRAHGGNRASFYGWQDSNPFSILS